MKKTFDEFNEFIKLNNIDLDLFYVVNIYQNKIILQGHKSVVHNKLPVNIIGNLQNNTTDKWLVGDVPFNSIIINFCLTYS